MSHFRSILRFSAQRFTRSTPSSFVEQIKMCQNIQVCNSWALQENFWRRYSEKTSKNDGFSARLRTKRDPIKVRLLVVINLVMRHLLHHRPKKSKDPVNHPSLDHEIFTRQSTVKIFKMAISKILDFSAGSKFAIKLPQDIRYDRESQNCD